MNADLALIDLADLAYLPFNSAARQLVFSRDRPRRAHGAGGRPDGARDGRLTMVDESRFREELAELMEIVERDYRQLAARQLQPFPT